MMRLCLLQNGYSENNISHLPNFTKTYDFDEVINRNKQFNNENENSILFVGRASFEKGIIYLLEAVSLITIPFKLYLVTGGSLLGEVQSRIKDLVAIGHEIDKIELIIMGGTFLSTNTEYQEDFIKGALEGIIEQKVGSLEEAKKLAETSKRRLVGVTIETRPDFCKENEIDRMLNYGTTRVEIGIQTFYDEIYKIVKRGHSTQDSIDAIRLAKDAGLKVNAHIMPNLPGSNFSLDLEMFNSLFTNSEYKPDRYHENEEDFYEVCLYEGLQYAGLSSTYQ